jgi:hypothetical protein
MAQPAHMARDVSLLTRNIARLRRDIRIQARELQALVDSDLDCTGAARVLVHMQSDLRLFLEKRERLQCAEQA